MIVYQATKAAFLDDVFKRDIDDIVLASFQAKTGRTVSRSEVHSWAASLVHIAKVLNHADVPDGCGVAVEYVVPPTGKRVDVILTGRTAAGAPCAVLVELKQWGGAERTTKDAVVVAPWGRHKKELSHPSYQAWTYAELLKGFNEAVQLRGIQLHPCAYLHNCPTGGGLVDPFYALHLARAPLFLRGESERARLRAFILSHIRWGDQGEALHAIEAGRIRPSRSVADALAGLLRGNPEFVLVDDQKVVYETALEHARAAQEGGKRVLIVEGGPGSGKTVVAINVLAALLRERLAAQYVTKNAAPRDVYAARLAGVQARSEFAPYFRGAGAFTQAAPDAFAALVVDEAHRLNARSGLTGNEGENQVMELIRSARFTVFFLDEDQRVTLKDIGSREEIRHWAGVLGATVHEVQLESQFRCNGAEGYLAWLDNVLGVRPTANEALDPGDFDFQVVDSAAALRDLVAARNTERNSARMVAGYCWEWRSKADPAAHDIELPGFRARWNLPRDGNLWIIAPGSVGEVGCIHTCQGLEVDYVGVIIGDDLVVRDGAVVTQPGRRASSDHSVRGWQRVAALGDAGHRQVDTIVRNTYRALMTRGMKGCYVYCVDPTLAEHLRRHLARPVAPTVAR